MTKKDYVRIAAVFRVYNTEAACEIPDCVGCLTMATLAERLADTLADDNPRFNRARFLKACGVEG